MKSDTQTALLHNIFMSNGLAPCITWPTGIANTSATSIDNIFVSAEHDNNCSSFIIISDILNHFRLVVGTRNSEDKNTKNIWYLNVTN